MKVEEQNGVIESWSDGNSGNPLLHYSSTPILRQPLFPRVPLAMPYWNGATSRAILRSLLSGEVAKGGDLGRLRSAVITMLGADDAVLCGSGSLALEIALRGCGVTEGDEVVIPTFCCAAVVSPILAVGAIPVPADIGDELNITVETVAAVLSAKTKAVVVPHLFGNPADIDAIADLARARNIRVIDDAAQALGATIHGRPVGSFGDGGILSFGSEKVCAGLGGGVVVFQNKDTLHDRIDVDLPAARVSSSLRALASTLLHRRWRRWMFPLLSRMRSLEPDAPPPPYRIEAMANLSAAVALSLMQTLRENVAARRARIDAYRELLGGVGRLELVPHRRGSACLTQVVRVLTRGRAADLAARVVAALNGAGYEVQGSYVPIHLLSCHRRWSRGPHSHAERVWADLIELPCEPDVSMARIEEICAITKGVLKPR